MEDNSIRLARIGYRCSYRSIKEMDLVLRKFWPIFRLNCTEQQLNLFESMLEEDDWTLYDWISSKSSPPERFSNLIQQIQEVLKVK